MDNLVFITIFLFLLFSSHIIFYKFFVILSHSFLKSGYSLSLFLFIFLFFLATLLYIDESLWFLKLYFGFICFAVVFFSSPLQVVSLSLSLIVLIWFFFELIFDYFGSKNLSLYQNAILAMLITDRHSVHFGPPHQFDLIRSTLVHFGQFWSNSFYFGPFQFN